MNQAVGESASRPITPPAVREEDRATITHNAMQSVHVSCAGPVHPPRSRLHYDLV
jgi:hypothetical protein